MEGYSHVIMSLLAATLVIGIVAALRSVTASANSPEWVGNDVVANGLALSSTVAIAATLFYVGYALSSVIPTGYAVCASFATHLAIAYAVFGFASRPAKEQAVAARTTTIQSANATA